MFDRLRYLLISSLFATSATATAAPVIAYDESVSGDLPQRGATQAPMLSLAAGKNLVLGTWTWTGHLDPITRGSVTDILDHDSFRFVVPVGYQLIELAFTATYDFVNVYSFSIGIKYDALDANGNIDLYKQYPHFHIYPMSYGVLDDSTQVLSDQIYADYIASPFRLTSGSISMPSGANMTYFAPNWEVHATYEFGLMVQKIPEPSTLALLGLGLAGLAATRRRRQ